MMHPTRMGEVDEMQCEISIKLFGLFEQLVLACTQPTGSRPKNDSSLDFSARQFVMRVRFREGDTSHLTASRWLGWMTSPLTKKPTLRPQPMSKRNHNKVISLVMASFLPIMYSGMAAAQAERSGDDWQGAAAQWRTSSWRHRAA